MASFTDNLEYLTRHTGYVQQNPVEVMREVGMYKQNQYDQGIQKIQQHIENVAGIDVVRDVDKVYLQTKLGELGNKLKSVAAGDFSQYQLVNSVGGMVTSIAKDKKVQNAASSTAWYRKQVEKMQKDVDEGKSNPANIDYFQKHANTWLSSSNAGEPFSGSYIPNFDVFKFAKETFDAIKPDGITFDQLYLTDNQGVPKTDREGRPILSPTMKRLEKEGLFSPKVKATIDQIFNDPRVDTQLSISGEYALKNQSPELLSSTIIEQKNRIVASLEDQLNKLTLQKNTDKDVQEQIDEVQLAIEKTKSRYDDFSKLALTNTDAVRGALYKDDVRNNYTTMFSWNKTKETALENPAWNANFKLNQEANRVREFQMKLDFEKDKEKFDRSYKLLKLKQEEEEKERNNNEFVEAGQSPDIKYYTDQFDTLYENGAKDYTAKSNNFIYKFNLSNPENDKKYQFYLNQGNSPDKSAELVMRDIVKQELIGEGIETTETNINNRLAAKKTTWTQEATTEVEKMSPASLLNNPSKYNNYMDYLNSKKNFEDMDYMKKRAEERMGPKLTNILNSSSFKIDPVVITTNEGKKITVTKDDMLNAAIYLKGNQSSIGFLNSPTLRREAEKAEEKLKREGKEYLIDYVLADYGEGINASEVMSKGPITSLIRGPMYDIHSTNNKLSEGIEKIYNSMSDDELVAAIESKAETIKELGFHTSPNLRKNIITGDAKIDDVTLGKIKTHAAFMENKGKGYSSLVDFDFDKIKSAIENKDYKAIELEVSKNDPTGVVTPELVFYDEDGDRLTGMIITPEIAKDVFDLDVSTIYEDPKLSRIKSRMNYSTYNSTSVGNPESIDTYMYGDTYYNNTDFPNMQNSKYNIKGNIYISDGHIYPALYVADDTKNKLRILPAQPDLTTAINRLLSTTPSFANSVLNEK